MDLGPSQPRIENGLNSQMVFQDESLQFSCGGAAGVQQRRVGDPVRKPAGGFMDEKMFDVDARDRYFRAQGVDMRRNIYEPRDRPENLDWNAEASPGGPSGDGSEGDEEDEDDEDEEEEDDVDEGDGEVEGLVVGEDGNKNNNSSGSVQSSSEKIRNEKANLQKHHHSSFGVGRGVLTKDGTVQSTSNTRGSLNEQQHQHGRMGHYENAITLVEPDIYYSQMLHGQDGSALSQKEIGGESGCGFSGRKDIALSVESGESLRAILSDPIMNKGWSSLRAAVQAFRREEELHSSRASKRRRDRLEQLMQDKGSYGDTFSMEFSRGKGVQFPFAVTDRVIIKVLPLDGVGWWYGGTEFSRVALTMVARDFIGQRGENLWACRIDRAIRLLVVECGHKQMKGATSLQQEKYCARWQLGADIMWMSPDVWYVVKTLDNAESVKLQYRSLAKVPDNPSNMISGKTITSNWL
ncbi:hypothetical protein ACLOJK_012218 [Asimina triloba]